MHQLFHALSKVSLAFFVIYFGDLQCHEFIMAVTVQGGGLTIDVEKLTVRCMNRNGSRRHIQHQSHVAEAESSSNGALLRPGIVHRCAPAVPQWHARDDARPGETGLSPAGEALPHSTHSVRRRIRRRPASGSESAAMDAFMGVGAACWT